MYSVEPFATEEYIYVMYIGKSKKEVEEQFENFRPFLERITVSKHNSYVFNGFAACYEVYLLVITGHTAL
jgi:hypothetical protein